jgi:predicted ester cyclase
MPGSTNEQYEILLIRWFEELWNKKNYDVVTKLVHDEFVDYGDGSQAAGLSSKRGPQAAVEVVKTWHAAFPDGRMTLEEVYSEGDRAVFRTTFRGTFEGSFAGYAGNGKKVTVTAMGINRIVDGKVIENWGDLNVIGVMQQIGALPIPA